MDKRLSKPRKHTLIGSFWFFMGESMMLPTGLLVIAILTRLLGAGTYGLYVLGLAIVSWMEQSASSIFKHSSILISSGRSEDNEVTNQITRIYLLYGLGLGLLLLIFAQSLAAVFGEPELTTVLKFLSLDIPLFMLSKSIRSIWIGQGKFELAASMGVLRWMVRLFLVMLLAIGGFSLMGAIAANVIASLVETAYAVSKQKINVVKLLGASSKMSFKVIIPVAILVIATRLFANMDLMLLRVLGTSIENVGIYGAAKNLAIIPGIIGLSYAPLLLSTLNRNLSSGKRENARITAGDAARSVFGLLPFAAIAAGSSEELAIMILGSEFAQSADFFTPLIIAAVFQTSFSISSAILMASKNVLSVAQLILSMVAFSFIGYFFLIPLHGSIAASWIMLLLSFLAAISGILLVKRHWQIIPPKMTVVRSLLLSMAAYFLSGTLQTNGATLLAELILLSMAVILSFLILGELSSDEIEQVKNIFSNSRWFSRKA